MLTDVQLSQVTLTDSHCSQRVTQLLLMVFKIIKDLPILAHTFYIYTFYFKPILYIK